MEIMKNIWQVGGGDLTAPEDAAVYMVEIEKVRVLFGQDVHGPLHPSLLSNAEDYMRSLKFLLSLNADILCEGHFGVFKGKQRIDAFIRSYIMG